MDLTMEEFDKELLDELGSGTLADLEYSREVECEEAYDDEFEKSFNEEVEVEDDDTGNANFRIDSLAE